VRWYGLEVIPLFLLASVLLWVGDVTHLFSLVVAGLQPVVHALGLPDAAADAFLFGSSVATTGRPGCSTYTGRRHLRRAAGSGDGDHHPFRALHRAVPGDAEGARVAHRAGRSRHHPPFAFGVGYLLNLVLVSLKCGYERRSRG